MTQSIEDQFQDAKALEAAGAYAQAAALFQELKAVPQQEIRARRRLSECLMRLQRWEETRTEVEAVFATTEPNNSDIQRWLAVRAHLSGPLVPADPVSARIHAERAAGTYPKGKYIVFTAAAPKTGSTSLSVALAAAMGASRANDLSLPITGTRWSAPWWPAVDALEGCGLVNHCHLSPTKDVMDEIAKRPFLRIAVHLRNPFETMESTIDLVLRQRSFNLLSAVPHLALAPDAELRDWAMSTYLARLAAWMRDWVALWDAKHPSIIGLTTMDMMRDTGQDVLARRLAQGLEGVAVQTADTRPQRTGQRLEGARKVTLTPAERAQVEAAIPADLRKRFHWD